MRPNRDRVYRQSPGRLDQGQHVCPAVPRDLDAHNFGDFTYFESIYPFAEFRAFITVNAGELDFFVGAAFY